MNFEANSNNMHQRHPQNIQQPLPVFNQYHNHTLPFQLNAKDTYFDQQFQMQQQVAPYSFFEQQRNLFSGGLPQMRMPSGYSACYQNIQETLYYEPGDGEIFVYYDTVASIQKMVTCIDISTLFKEKRAKAITITNFLGQVRHQNVVQIYSHQIVDEKFVYIEMEVPQNLSQWKTFCKKKFMPDEVFNIVKQVTQGLEFLHRLGFIHRDVHPSRFQQFQNNVIKFNPIGLPYNFKKLLKRDNFSGHINYSAPELILEKAMFQQKVDVWSLGCCLYYLIVKKDPFDGPDPNDIKRNILNLNLDINQYMMIPMFLRPIIEACLILDENVRPTSSQLLQLLNQMQNSFKYQTPESPSLGVQQYNNTFLNTQQALLQSQIIQHQQNPNQQQNNQVNNSVPNGNYQNLQQLQQLQQSQNLNFQHQLHHQQQMQQIGSPQKLIIPFQIKEFIPNKHKLSNNNQQSNEKYDQFSQSNNYSDNFNTTPRDGAGNIQAAIIDKMQQLTIQNNCSSSITDTKSSSLFDHDLRKDFSFDSDRKDKITSYASNCSEGDIYGSDNQGSLSSPDPKNQILDDVRRFAMSHQSQNQFANRQSTEMKVIFNDEDGNIYEGEMQNNQKHGLGKQIFPNGSFYEGQWKNGQMDGQGKLVLTTGEVYFGQFVKGKRHGKGKLIFSASGDVYEGDWNQDKMTGKGKYFYSDQKVFEGDFVEGAPYGYGVMSCRQFYYEGYFKSGLFEGIGKLIDNVNNQIFEGEYYDGKRKGPGRLIDTKTGDIFEGCWLDDKKVGPGKMRSMKNGFTIQGNWKNDEIQTQVVNSEYIDSILIEDEFETKKESDNLYQHQQKLMEELDQE